MRWRSKVGRRSKVRKRGLGSRRLGEVVWMRREEEGQLLGAGGEAGEEEIPSIEQG